MIIVLHNQLWGSVEMVKSKFRGFVSSELLGVPNTREIRYLRPKYGVFIHVDERKKI